MKKLFEGLLLYLRIRKIDELRVRLDIEDSTVASEEYMNYDTSEEISVPKNFTVIFNELFEKLQEEIEGSFSEFEYELPVDQSDDFGTEYNVIFNVDTKEKNINIWTEISYKTEGTTIEKIIKLSELLEDDKTAMTDLLDDCDCDILTVNFFGDYGEFIIDEFAEGDSGDDISIDIDHETIIHELTQQIEPSWYSGYGGKGLAEITKENIKVYLALYDYEVDYDVYEKTIDINFFD